MNLASHVIMRRPTGFKFDPATSASNSFQHPPAVPDAEVRAMACAEFDGAVQLLRAAGVRVTVLDDPAEVAQPNAVFPNNWISFHAGGQACLYPMATESRRRERLPALLEAFGPRETFDLTPAEESGKSLEGTGSLVLDRAQRTAYAALSPRTDADLARRWAAHMGFDLTLFETLGPGDLPIYHTNVMMAIGSGFAVLCEDVISDRPTANRIREQLTYSGKQVVTITEDQMTHFCGNLLELGGASGPVIALSEQAFGAFTQGHRKALAEHGKLVALKIPTIEAIGGGSVRCMLCEVF